MNHKILLVALLMLCACAGIKAANYEPFSDVTTANGIYNQGSTVKPGVDQNTTVFNDTYVPFGSEPATNNAGGDIDSQLGGSGIGELAEPINGGWYILFGLGCLVAALRIKKVLAEE